MHAHVSDCSNPKSYLRGRPCLHLLCDPSALEFCGLSSVALFAQSWHAASHLWPSLLGARCWTQTPWHILCQRVKKLQKGSGNHGTFYVRISQPLKYLQKGHRNRCTLYVGISQPLKYSHKGHRNRGTLYVGISQPVKNLYKGHRNRGTFYVGISQP